MRLLVSLPYSNNQWLYQWIRSSEYANQKSILLPSEFKLTTKKFKPITTSTKNHGIRIVGYSSFDEITSYTSDYFLKSSYNVSFSLEEKIEYIEHSKKFGLDVCYNCETTDLFLPYKSKLVWDWFKDFYKNKNNDDNVLLSILLNKDLWNHWIKFLFYRTILLKLPTLTDDDLVTNTPNVWNFDVVKSYIETNKITFTYKEDVWKDFLKNLRLLHEDIIGFKNTKRYSYFKKDILWLEDLSTESLTLKFESIGPLVNRMVKSKLNYESYFSTKDLDFMKKQFDTYKENEFIYYGYK